LKPYNGNLSQVGLHAYYVKQTSAQMTKLLNPWGPGGTVDLEEQDYSAIEIVYILDPV
jgi:hypothetical protein